MDITTLMCLIAITAILVGGWLMGKEMDLRKPPPDPLSDAAAAIDVLEDQLGVLNSFYEADQDNQVLQEISKINATLASIATKPTGNMCKCGVKKL